MPPLRRLGRLARHSGQPGQCRRVARAEHGRRGGTVAGELRFGFPRHHHRRCDSTNTQARGLAALGAPAGTVVTADEQTGGRGRQGRSWSAPAGTALLYSAILRPLEERHQLLPLAVPGAVCDTIEAISDHQCRVKWPNDVWIDGRKVAGVLIEARPQDGWAVIGVGLNISIAPDEFPEGLRGQAVSVGGDATVAEALDLLNRSLPAWCNSGPETVLEAFGERDALRGREVAWEGAGARGSGSGVADGIDERGNLVVITGDDERISLGAGEVHLIPG